MPRVSVIIPTYNRREYVQEAIDSVLAQTYTDYEIIVIDDGSTDGTGEALRERYGDRIIYEWQENQGESAARNRGLALAQGEYIAFLDSDDLWLPDKLEKQVTYLDEHPEMGAVFCEAHTCDAHGERLQTVLGAELEQQALILDTLLMANWVSSPSALVGRAELLHRVGGFDPAIRFAEDWDLWLRLRQRSEIGYLPEPLASVRVHGNNQWRLPRRDQVERSLQDHLRLLERAFDACKEIVPDWEALRRRSLARQYAEAAFNGYARGLYEEARGWLEQARGDDPTVWAQPHAIVEGLASVALVACKEPRGAGCESCDDFCRRVAVELPAGLISPRGLMRQLKARLYAELGFSAYLGGDHRAAVHYMLEVVRFRPQQISNVGMLKRLIRSLWGGYAKRRVVASPTEYTP